MTREEIERMEAGQDMDLLVSEIVMGWNVDEWNRAFFNNRSNFSTDIAAAWQVVEKLYAISHSIEIVFNPDRGISKTWISKGKTVTGTPAINPNPNPFYTARIMIVSEKYPQCWSGIVSAVSPTAPLAICRAALLAVMTGKETK